MRRHSLSLLDPRLCRQACRDAILKLDPRCQWRNPVMFVVWLGSVITTLVGLSQWLTPAPQPSEPLWFVVSLWLWFTLLFANFAEALAEGRSKAQAASLRGLQQTVWANKLSQPQYGASTQRVNADQLHKGDLVQVAAGEIIPCDGDVVVGVASVDESAITGESAPVIREAGCDFSSVTGGTRVLSDWLVIRATVNPGETFLDRMIAMVEGAQRRKTPNEIALTILLIALTLIFLLATTTLLPFSWFAVATNHSGQIISLSVLIALLVCLIPTTIGGLLSAIGVAGMSRMLAANVIATSGRAVEAAGDVDVLLLDKTGTITLGNRQASQFLPVAGVSEQQLADAAQLASLADETPEGRSIVVLAKQRFNLRERDIHALGATFVPFSAQTRMSGVNLQTRLIRKGAAPRDEACDVDLAVAQWCLDHSCAAGLGTDTLPALPQRLVPLVTGQQVLGVLAIEPQHQRLLMIPEQLRLLELYAVLIAIALKRIKLAREAEQAQLQMESERLRNSLLSALSHDLRTPLTVLFGQAEILTLELGLAQSPQAELANAMRQQVLNTTRLVNNLLDMARLQSGGLSLRREWQSLPELIGSALHELAVPLQGHEVVHEIPADFPLLYADGAMLERVLVNVLENGCKYAGAKATFGIGARLHGGRIRAENRPQGGARFSFTLPYKVPPQVWENIMEEA